jgi:Lon protease-like protein
MEPGVFPVFPLHSVCFPGHRIALRIFEDRYLRLLEDAADHPFFVSALIRSGEEVGAPASPYLVGTLLQFESIEDKGDYRCIRPLGVKRLYFDGLDRERHPYLCARCAAYPDEEGCDSGRLRELEARILTVAAASAGGAVERLEARMAGAREMLDEENYSLFLCGCLQLPPIYGQRLLESRSRERRVADALQLLCGTAP